MSIDHEDERESELVSLKLVIDTKRKRILYGEVDKEFIDFLFTILALPMGTVVKQLVEKTSTSCQAIGSLGSLYRSAVALNPSYFETNHNKNSLLNPGLPTTIATGSQIGRLLQIQSCSKPEIEYYTCSSNRRPCRSFSGTRGIECSTCFRCMENDATYEYGDDETRPIEGGYVKGGVFKYMVMDDLSVKPISFSTISILNELNVDNIGQLREEIIDLNAEDGLKMLSVSMHSLTVLNDMFLPRIGFSQYSETNMSKDCMQNNN